MSDFIFSFLLFSIINSSLFIIKEKEKGLEYSQRNFVLSLYFKVPVALVICDNNEEILSCENLQSRDFSSFDFCFIVDSIFRFSDSLSFEPKLCPNDRKESNNKIFRKNNFIFNVLYFYLDKNCAKIILEQYLQFF